MDQAEIDSYIRKALKLGSDKETIKKGLINAGLEEKQALGSIFRVKNETGNKVQKNDSDKLISSLSRIKRKSLTSLNEGVASIDGEKIFDFNRASVSSASLSNTQTGKRRGFPFLSLQYYRDILNLGRKVNVFLILLLIAFASAVRPGYFIVKASYPFTANFESRLKSVIRVIYPEELEIRLADGHVSTNVPEPYYFDIPEGAFGKQLPAFEVNLLAIDTGGAIDDFNKYGTCALLTETDLVYYPNRKVEIKSLKNTQDLVIDRAYLFSELEKLNRNNRIENFLRAGLVLAPFLIIIFMLVFVSLNVFLLSLVIWLIAKAKHWSLGFKRVFSYTTAVSFLPLLFFSFLGFLIPFSLLIRLGPFLMMAVLGLAGFFLVKRHHS